MLIHSSKYIAYETDICHLDKQPTVAGLLATLSVLFSSTFLQPF